jgi:hypothetical protein
VGKRAASRATLPSKEYIVASYHRCDYVHLGMEQVEQSVTFMAAFELETFIYEHETCPEVLQQTL